MRFSRHFANLSLGKVSLNNVHAEALVWRCSVKNGVLRNVAKFTGKHLCQSLFLEIVAGLDLVLQLYQAASVYALKIPRTRAILI